MDEHSIPQVEKTHCRMPWSTMPGTERVRVKDSLPCGDDILCMDVIGVCNALRTVYRNLEIDI